MYLSTFNLLSVSLKSPKEPQISVTSSLNTPLDNMYNSVVKRRLYKVLDLALSCYVAVCKYFRCRIELLISFSGAILTKKKFEPNIF